MSAAADDETLRFYAASAAEYARQGEGIVFGGLGDFLDLMPAGARVLELGCGAGREARVMADAGIEVDATDGSAALVDEARRRTGLPVRLMRFDQLDAVARYDGVLANASLLHVWPEALPGIMSRIHRALRPGGWLMASFKTGGEPGRDAHGRYFNHPTAEALATLCQAAGFAAPALRREVAPGYLNEPADWLIVTAQA